MAGGVTQELQNLTDVGKKTGLSMSQLAKSVRSVSSSLAQVAYLTGRTASGLSSMMQKPMSLATGLQKSVESASKTFSNFENAVYLSGQRLGAFSGNIKTAEQGMNSYRNAVEKATKGTKIATFEAEKMLRSLIDTYQGLPSVQVVNDFANIQNSISKVGGSIEETQKLMDKLSASFKQYGALRKALASGNFDKAASLSGALSLTGDLEGDIANTYRLLAVQNKLGDSARSRSNRIFESERAVKQGAFDTHYAMGGSTVNLKIVDTYGALGKAQSTFAGMNQYGNIATALGFAGEIGNIFSSVGAGAGALGDVGESGSRGMTPQLPLYVEVVAGGGSGISGGFVDAAQTVALLRGGGAAGKVGMLGRVGSVGAMSIPGTSSVGTSIGAIGAGTTIGGLSTIAAAAAAAIGILAVGEGTYNAVKTGSIYNSNNFLSRGAKSLGEKTGIKPIQGIMDSLYGVDSDLVEQQELNDKINTQVNELEKKYDSISDKLSLGAAEVREWRIEHREILLATQGIAELYSNIQGIIGDNVGYASDSAKFAKAESEFLQRNFIERSKELEKVEELAKLARESGSEEEALSYERAALQVRSEIYIMQKKIADQNLKARTAEIDAATTLQKQEIELSKVIRDRNIEARLGIGVSYQDQLDIVKDIAGQIPILEQKMKAQLQEAAKQRENNNMKAALDFEKQAKDTKIEIEQAKLDFFRESKAIREGYLDAFKENIFGAGGFAKILPKVGAGNQFMADIAPLGGVGTSGVNTPGKYTTSGLQVSGGYGQTVDYLNRGVNAQFYGALQGAQAQGGIDPLASEMLGESAIPMKETADSTKRTEDRMSDLLGILKGATNGNAVNVNLVGGGVPNAGSGLFNMGATGAGITYGASPNIPAGANTSAPFLTPGAALNSGGSRYGITSPQRQGGRQTQARPGYLSLMQQTDTKGFVGGMIDQWAGLKTDSDRARMSAGLTAREGTLAGEYDQAKAELDALWSEYQREGFNNGMPKASEGDRYLKYQELTRRGRDAQARLRNASMERGGLSRARMGIERFEETGDRDSAVSFATQGSNTILSSAEQKRLEEATRNYEKEAREAGVYGMSADAMNKVREQDRFAKDSIAMNNLNEAYSARRELDRVRQEIGLTVYVATEEGEAGQVQYTIGSTSNPATRNAFNNA